MNYTRLAYLMNPVLGAFLFLVFLSCETKLEVELPVPDKKLVLNGLINPFNPPYAKGFRIQLYSNYAILDTTKSEQIEDAEVLWYINDEFTDTLYFNKEFKGYTVPGFYFPETGNKYSIRASKDGFTDVTAFCTIPEKVLIDTVEINSLAGINDERFAYASVILTFDDPTDQVNYYDVTISSSGMNSEGFYKIWSSEKVITNEAYYPSDLTLDKEYPTHLLFPDTEFNGEKNTLIFYYEPPQWEDVNKKWVSNHIIYVCLRSVTEDYYNFLTSALQQQNNRQGDLFYGLGEPIQVNSNIENGYGIFTGYNYDGATFFVDSATVYSK